jgi:hypothetical protein
MTMASVSNFGDNPRLLFVCAVSRERLVARVVVCVLAMVNGRWECSYRFLADFLLINRSTLFFLINKNSKSFDWLKNGFLVLTYVWIYRNIHAAAPREPRCRSSVPPSSS